MSRFAIRPLLSTALTTGRAQDSRLVLLYPPMWYADRVYAADRVRALAHHTSRSVLTEPNGPSLRLKDYWDRLPARVQRRSYREEREYAAASGDLPRHCGLDCSTALWLQPRDDRGGERRYRHGRDRRSQYSLRHNLGTGAG